MRVRRDFEEIYATEEDPWKIGDANSRRYDLYVQRILEASERRGSVLELGCGFGALLARFADHFERLVGMEIAAAAIERGRERFPFIEFHRGSLADPAAALPVAESFDTIIVSDVLYYLPERQRRTALAWVREHLAPGGLAFLAGWSPGGRYLTVEEFRNLIDREVAIESEQLLDTQHALFLCRRRRTLVALTVDYETWQPQLEGVSLDWERDALTPTTRLLDAFDAAGATLTIFAEMGEYLWLAERDARLARLMEEQWRDAVRRGHDVQLHLHPNWLPELEPRVDDGQWTWDTQHGTANDYPGDLGEAIERCRTALERAIRPQAPAYEVLAFRAGTYEAQPFRRLYDALVDNRIWCDSSVVPGDRRPGRQYDYTHAYAEHQPWLASRYDPQLKAPPAERGIVELPVFTPRRGERWTFDNEEGARFAGRLIAHLAREHRRPSSQALRRRRKLRTVLNDAYWRLRGVRGPLNRVLPRRVAYFMADYAREQLAGNDYFVLVAHTKGELDFDAIAAGLQRLAAEPDIELVSMSELARTARAELERGVSRSRETEAERQVQREYTAVMSRERNTAPSRVLQGIVPLDRQRILDAGCGAGDWSAALAAMYPWTRVSGADVGEDFIARATREFASERISFSVEDFAAMSFATAEFDCVYADNSLEHAFDVDATLRELHRVLAPGGCLVAAIPADGYNAHRTCDNHTWKTVPADVRARVAAAGFVDIDIREVDIFRTLGQPPFPPANDVMLYVQAWTPAPGRERLARARELTRWAYATLDPREAQASNDPLEILAGGHAWCWGYVVVLGEALRRERYGVSWVTMVAEDHPLGLGERRRDSHEVLEVDLGDGRRIVCDPMAGAVFECTLRELLLDPERADAARDEDERYRERNYALYSTSAWYRLVRRVAVRSNPNARLRLRPVAAVLGARS